MNTIFALGLVLVVGVIGGKLARKLNLPSVTGYIFIGVLIGPSVLGIITDDMVDMLRPINEVAIGILAVSIGGELKFKFLRGKWPYLGRILWGEAVFTFLFVALITGLLAKSAAIGIILGTLALASAPNTTMAIFKDYKLRGDFPRTVLSLVALDNFLCLIIFSFTIGFLSLYFQEPGNADAFIWISVIGSFLLSIAVGTAIGFFLLFLNRTIKSDSEYQVLILAFILMGVGIGITLNLPTLFIAMLIGMVLVNLAPRPERFFRILRQFDTPILVAFLTLAGLKLRLDLLSQVGVLGMGYVVARFLGKILGCSLGGFFCRSMPGQYRQNIGISLTPQAGVAVGLSIMVEQKIPAAEGLIITLILGSVIIFEIIGPLLVRRALVRTDSIEKPLN